MSKDLTYKEIFQKEIIQKSQGVIFSYSPVTDQYKYKYTCQYHPNHHDFSKTAVKDLGELMRHNLFFYAFGEEEVVYYYNKDRFSSLQEAAKYSYQQRLPKRADINDGLPGEVLLDLLVQLYNPNVHKLAVRTLFRQDDNNEIKGYDLTYFTKDETGISLWLGQAKLGEKNYCKSSIHKDLLEKFKKEYLAKQLFFVCDKRIGITDEAKAILETIEEINLRMINADNNNRSDQLINYFKQHNIKIKIPCLLAYGKDTVYADKKKAFEKIQAEVYSIRQYYSENNYTFDGFAPDIVFYILPIKNIKDLRDKGTGFYAGLC